MGKNNRKQPKEEFEFNPEEFESGYKSFQDFQAQTQPTVREVQGKEVGEKVERMPQELMELFNKSKELKNGEHKAFLDKEEIREVNNPKIQEAKKEADQLKREIDQLGVKIRNTVDKEEREEYIRIQNETSAKERAKRSEEQRLKNEIIVAANLHKKLLKESNINYEKYLIAKLAISSKSQKEWATGQLEKMRNKLEREIHDLHITINMRKYTKKEDILEEIAQREKRIQTINENIGTQEKTTESNAPKIKIPSQLRQEVLVSVKAKYGEATAISMFKDKGADAVLLDEIMKTPEWASQMENRI